VVGVQQNSAKNSNDSEPNSFPVGEENKPLAKQHARSLNQTEYTKQR
jgi:hypothetical protein